MDCDKTLLDFTSEQLVLALVDRDLSSVSEDLKSIVLYQIGTSLNESLQAESKTFAGISMNLTSFEKVDPEKFITSDDRCLPVIKFVEGLTGKSFGTLPTAPCAPKSKKLHIPETTKNRNFELCGQIYECVLKLVNSNCLPPISLTHKIDIRTKINSRTALESDKLGGSYRTVSGVNIKAEIPNNINCHAKIIDNGQKGRGKIQKKQRLKLQQKVEVAVHTNVISVTSLKFENSDILKKSENMPSNFEEHPYFNKTSGNDYEFLETILREKIDNCDQVKDIILNKWFLELLTDIEKGGGESSAQKTFQENLSGKIVTFFCHNCHYKNEYDVMSENVCPSCSENPSFFKMGEGPMDKYGIVGQPKEVKVEFQEPLCYNPVGENLKPICEELSTKMPPGDKIQCIISDALINVGLLRTKRKIMCETHSEVFAMWDEAKVIEHSSLDCVWQRPLENVINFDGQSHELMNMILNYTRALKAFGIKDYVKMLGFISDSAQDTALRGKYLRRLIEIVNPFTEGALRALMDSYISKIASEDFDYISFKNFMKTSPNLRARALFNVTMEFGMSVFVKHLSLRLSRPDLARFASAAFTPLSFLMNNLMYRENFCYAFIHDGPDVMDKEDSHVMEDRNVVLCDELSDEQKVDEAFKRVIEELKRNKRPSKKSYIVTGRFLTQDLKQFKDEVTIIDRATDGKSGQGADMVQEEFLKKGLSKVAAGKINSFPVFRDGIRSAHFSDILRGGPTHRNKRRFKFGLEALSSSLVQMRRGDTLNLDLDTDLSDLDEDLLRIRDKGLANLKTFFMEYVAGKKPPTSVKLEPLFLQKSDRERFEAIESKTKAEILEKIQGFNLDDLDCLAPDVLEVLYKRKFNIARFSKAELVEIYQKLFSAEEEMVILQGIEESLS